MFSRGSAASCLLPAFQFLQIFASSEMMGCMFENTQVVRMAMKELSRLFHYDATIPSRNRTTISEIFEIHQTTRGGGGSSYFIHLHQPLGQSCQYVERVSISEMGWVQGNQLVSAVTITLATYRPLLGLYSGFGRALSFSAEQSEEVCCLT